MLSAQEIKKLLPEKIMNGYSRGESGNAKVLKIGNLQYSMAEISFVNGRKQIKVLLFDYGAAQIMYEQSVKKFKTFEPVQSDSISIQPLQTSQGNGWQVSKPRSQTAQVAMGIFDRFYLTLEGTQVEPEEVIRVLDFMPFQKFPK